MNEQRTSGIATVMFTDVEGSTDITTRLGDDAAASLFATHDRIVRDQVAAHGGRDVRSTGDGFLVVFDSARAAVSCALAIQRELAEQDGAVRVRIGLNAGELLEGDGELFGAAVNLAARVMDRANGGEVLMTDTVRQLVGTIAGAAFRERGRVVLKGFPERQRLYEVRPADRRPDRPSRPRRSSPPPRRRRRVVVAAGLAVCVVGAVVAVALLAGGGNSGNTAVATNAVAVIDPRTNNVANAIPVGEDPGPIAAADGRVWALNLGNATLSQIDARTRRVVETTGVGGEHPAGNLAATRGNLWVAEGCQDGGSAGLSRIDTTLRPISAREASPILLDTADKARPTGGPVQSSPGCGLVAEGRSVWIASTVPVGIARLDIEGDSPQADVARVRALPFATTALAIGAGSLWLRDTRGDVVWRTDPRTLADERSIQTGRDPSAIAVGARAVWVANSGDGSVSRIDPRTSAVTRAISVGDAPVALAVGAGAVWVANSGDGTVSRIDPRTNKVIATIRVGHRPQGIAIAAGAVWVTVRR
jgi:YVTN family beta-propeller protein